MRPTNADERATVLSIRKQNLLTFGERRVDRFSGKTLVIRKNADERATVLYIRKKNLLSLAGRNGDSFSGKMQTDAALLPTQVSKWNHLTLSHFCCLLKRKLISSGIVKVFKLCETSIQDAQTSLLASVETVSWMETRAQQS